MLESWHCIGFDWKCVWLFFCEINFRQSSIFKSECYISFAPLQRQFKPLAEWVHILRVYLCVYCIPLFLNSFQLPRAPSAETWLLFFWFHPCLCWISVIELVSYCVWSNGVQSAYENLHRTKWYLYNPTGRSVCHWQGICYRDRKGAQC